MKRIASALLLLTIYLIVSANAVVNLGPPNCGQCGNQQVQPLENEQCDDGNNDNLDGCNSQCQLEDGYDCVGSPSVCSLLVNNECGNRIRNNNE